MSSRARRVSHPATVVSFPWDRAHAGHEPAQHEPVAHAPEPEPAGPSLAAIEAEAYARGVADGEVMGAARSREGTEALLTRLTQTLEELTNVRAEMIRKTERQMVELALAVARRIVHREVSLDKDLLMAMTRVALERLSGSATV